MHMKRAFGVITALLALGSPQWAHADPLTPSACADAYVQGQLLRNAHKLLLARAALRICVQQACRDFMVRDCSEWLDMVQASVPAVVLVAIDEMGSPVSNVTVSMDHTPLMTGLDGNAVDVDPGLHTFEFFAPDGRKATKSIVVPEGDKWVRVTVTLARSVPASPASHVPGATDAPPPQLATSLHATNLETVRSNGAFPWKAIGLATTGTGVLGLGVGTFFGLDMLSKRSAAGCNGTKCPNNGAMSEYRAAQRSGDFATGFFVAGGILTVAGLTLWAGSPGQPVRMAAHAEATKVTFGVTGVW
jgi:hypothetical protein